MIINSTQTGNFSKPAPEIIAEKLLTWFNPAARPMPWRTLDPEGPLPSAYGIWISEIMLQQTQVATVIPYWKRWMKTLPDISTLARAREEEVIKLWEGLGYYNRARNILKAARFICTHYKGIFPKHPEEIIALAGIGRYTAGAICSIAYNLPCPIVDGNVIRLLCRLYALSIPAATASSKTSEPIWQLSAELVQSADKIHHPMGCSFFNQAMMDMGATLCTPQSPDCNHCPLTKLCCAFQQGNPLDYPLRKSVPPLTHREDIALYCRDSKGRVLISRRPPGVRNHGFWQLPMLEETKWEAAYHQFAKINLILSKELLCKISHNITRYQITVFLYSGQIDGKLSLDENLRFVSEEELKTLPVTHSHRKLLKKMDGKLF